MLAGNPHIDRAALAAIYAKVDPLAYLGMNAQDRALLDITTNRAIEHVTDMANNYVAALIQAFTGVNPLADNGGDVDETITPDTPATVEIMRNEAI